MKTKTKETPYQKRIVLLILINFALGVMTLAYVDVIQLVIEEGLYHKIISLGFFNLPIGMISIALFSVMIAIEAYLIMRINIKVYSVGLESIPVKGENKNAKITTN